MEGKGRSRRRSPHQQWKRRLSSVLAIVLTAVMVLNMPLSIDGLGLHVSNAFASASNADRKDSVWATASNAKYKQGESQDVDIYVIADDNGAVPGNTSSMTLYLKNNTNQMITEGVLTFKGSHIQKEDGVFQDIGAGDEASQVIVSGPGQDAGTTPESGAAADDGAAANEGAAVNDGAPQAADVSGNDAAQGTGLAQDTVTSGEGLLYEESFDADEAGEDSDFAEDFEGDEEDSEEEETWKLTGIDLQPGEMHEVSFAFYTDEDVKSTKAHVKFSFAGEDEEGERVSSDTQFYYSIGLPHVNISLEDGMQIESNVNNDMEIWMTEPDWVDEDLEERIEDQEEKEAEKEQEEDADNSGSSDTASDSNASKSDADRADTASDSQADREEKPSVIRDEEKIDKYTDEAMTISESRVSYTVEIFGAEYDLHARKADEVEDIGWISCVYKIAKETQPGIYYGKVTAAGRWNNKKFTSEQGFLFEVTGEWDGNYTAKSENVTVHAHAEDGVLPKNVTLKVTELEEGGAEYNKAKEAMDGTDIQFDGIKALDIRFENQNGEEVEPEGEVQISIEMKEGALPADAALDTVEVHHLKEVDDETIEVETVADAAGLTDGTVKSGEAVQAELEEIAADAEEETEASADVYTQAAIPAAAAAPVTLDAVAEVDKDTVAVAEFSVESFSSFTITWGEWWEDYFEITVHYVDEVGNDIIGKQESNVPISNNDTVIFGDYAEDISGIRCSGAHYGDFRGVEVTRAEATQSGGRNPIRTITFYNNSELVDTLIYDSDTSNTCKADVYLVYPVNDLSIQNNIMSSGNLTAVPPESISAQVSEYRWYRSEDGITWGNEPIEKINYAGGISNITGEKNVNLNVSIDSRQQDTDSRYYYKVEAYDSEGQLLAASEAFLNPYYTELKNGGFEEPSNSKNPKGDDAFEWTQDNYLAAGGIWQTTAEPSEIINRQYNEIEILQAEKEQYDKDSGVWSTALKLYFAWGIDLDETPPDGVQFAELNGGNAGALYQDVLTLEGQQLNYWLSHRARGNNNRETEFDTMYLVIMPTEVAVTNNLTTQDNLEDFLSSHNVDDPNQSYRREASEKVYDQDGIMIYRITSDDQDWHYFSGMDYVATSYLTRFFFVSGATDVGNNTEGNFLDRVGFGTKLPPIEKDKGHLQITKIVNGLTDAERETYEVVLSGTPNVSDTLRDFETFSRDSVSYQNLDAGNSYTIEEQVQDVSLEAKYDVTTTVSVNGGPPTENDSVTIRIVEDAVTTVTFTNTYTPKVGNLTVKKLVDGNMADATEQFDFVLTLKNGDVQYTEDLNVNGVIYEYKTGLTGYGDEPISGYVFQLAHNEEIHFDIPYGYKWTVTEKPPVGYTGVSCVVDSGPLVQNSYTASGIVSDSSTVTFTNTKTVDTPTGIASERLPYLMMLAIAAVGATSFIYPTCRRRRHKGDR